MKSQQNYRNHTHWVPLYHLLTYPAIALVLIGFCVTAFKAQEINLERFIFIALGLCVASVALHSRSFALKAQDRAIRAEENLRYFIITGKRIPEGLSLGQVIALRFASDGEFVELADRAARESMTPDSIKRAIKEWRPDHYRA